MATTRDLLKASLFVLLILDIGLSLFRNGFYETKNLSYKQQSSLNNSLTKTFLDNINRTRAVLDLNPRNVFYNRLVKSGSRSFLNLVKKLAKRNNFTKVS